MQTENHFGLKTFTDSDLVKLSCLPANLLKLLKSHRGFDTIDSLTCADKYYLYTGRGTSCASLVTRNNKTMLTTHGIRSYLTYLIIKEMQ